MADFETNAELTLSVSNRELRQVRQEIEDELSDVALGLSPSMGGGGSTAGGGGETDGREQRRRRREFRWARQRTSDMEDAVALLEEIEDKVGQGGGGSGLLDDVAGIGGDFASEIGGALPGLVANAVGSAVGTAVGQAISSNEVSVEEVDPLPVQRQRQPVEETSIEVEDKTLGVEDVPPLEVADVPALNVDDPSPLQVEDIPTVEVKRPEWKVGVEQPEPIEVNVTGGGGGGRDKRPRGRTLGELEREGLRKLPGGEGIASAQKDVVTGLREGVSNVPFFGGVEPARFGNEPSNIDERGQPIEQGRNRGSRRGGGGSGGGSNTTAVQAQQTTEIRANVEINVDSDQIVSEATDAFEQEISQVERELQRDIRQLERRIQRATS